MYFVFSRKTSVNFLAVHYPINKRVNQYTPSPVALFIDLFRVLRTFWPFLLQDTEYCTRFHLANADQNL